MISSIEIFSLIQETKLDRLVRKLASNKTASYSSTARHLLQKWHHKKLLISRSKPIESISPQLTTDVSQSTEIKREENESQTTDDQKKRKVLSLAEYLQTKKHVLSPSSTLNSSQNQLTDRQIKVINAQFRATTEKLTANANDLANIVNKSLIEPEKPSSRLQIPSNSSQINSQQSKINDFWAEDDDDDYDDDNNDESPNNIHSQISQSRTVNNNFHTQKV